MKLLAVTCCLLGALTGTAAQAAAPVQKGFGDWRIERDAAFSVAELTLDGRDFVLINHIYMEHCVGLRPELRFNPRRTGGAGKGAAR